MVNEIKTQKKGGVFTPKEIVEERTLEGLAGSIAAINTKLDRLERQQEIEETRGVASFKPVPTGKADDYREGAWEIPEATGNKVIPLKESVDPRSWSMISQLPRGASTSSGHKPEPKPVEIIGVSTTGRQTRWTETVQPEKAVTDGRMESRGVNAGRNTPSVRGPNIASVYTELVTNQDPVRFNDVSPGYISPSEVTPTQQGVMTLQDSVRELTGTLRRVLGKK